MCEMSLFFFSAPTFLLIFFVGSLGKLRAGNASPSLGNLDGFIDDGWVQYYCRIHGTSGRKSPGTVNSMLVSGGKSWSAVRNSGIDRTRPSRISGPYMAFFGSGLGSGLIG